MIQRMLAIWSLVPLPFLKPAWTSGSSRFMYCWSLAWRILSISLLVCPSNEYSGLISFRIDWLDLLAVQGTFRSLLQHHSLKVSILQCSPFFMVQLSCLYTTTRKIIPLIIQNFVSKVMCLLFNMMYSTYRLNKQGDNRQPGYTPFSILNQSVVLYRVITVASWPAYRFLRSQVRCSGIPMSLIIFHSLLWSTQSRALA